MACRRITTNIGTLGRYNVIRSTLPLTNVVAKREFASSKEEEIKTVTHTGQVFDTKDYRNVRFVNAARIVNPNFGVDLVNEIPPKECTERVVWCDGGDPHLGHPKVYINLDKPGAHACGYCGLRFIRKEGHH